MRSLPTKKQTEKRETLGVGQRGRAAKEKAACRLAQRRTMPASARSRGHGNEVSSPPQSPPTTTGEETLLLDVNPVVRFPLLALNLALWVTGGLLMLAALWTLVDSWDWQEESRILRRFDMPGLLLSHLQLVLFAGGLALLLISSCGCVGALRENTFLLRTYSFAITMLIFVNFTLGLIVFFVPGSVKSAIRNTLSDKLVVNYRESQDIQQLVDSLQRYLRCCGMTEANYRDWDKNIYFHCATTNPSYERCSVPASCCRENVTSEGIFCARSVLNMSEYLAWFRVYSGNCPDVMHRYVREHVMAIGGACLIAVIVLAFVQMITHSVIEEIEIIRRIYDRVTEAVNAPSPEPTVSP
ncbi:hypothetical protein HPB48_008215 [Haemaphysalis longicornis]|uniref:Tetraspanin n=1 Tax=Haemaphysalis longicornis TaxID=44386 RepID=A0A9J6H1Z3_HAELO|nr:hypothetical protein HPB48_008215 [Haemaphysalis longicornis]